MPTRRKVSRLCQDGAGLVIVACIVFQLRNDTQSALLCALTAVVLLGLALRLRGKA